MNNFKLIFRAEIEFAGQTFVMVYTNKGEELYRLDPKTGIEMFIRYATESDLAVFETLAPL